MEIYKELENINNVNVIKTMGKLKREDLIQHIKSNEYEILKGKIHWWSGGTATSPHTGVGKSYPAAGNADFPAVTSSVD